MKKFLFFLLFSISAISQSKLLTIEQIDSICLISKNVIEERFEFEREVDVSHKKTVKIKAEALLKIYKTSYSDTIKVNRIETVGPDYFVPKPEIIKASYEYEIIYNKKSVEYVTVELYYQNNKIKNMKVLNRYYNGTYKIFTDLSTVKKNDITYFSFCQSFIYWVDLISTKIDNIFYERKWE